MSEKLEKLYDLWAKRNPKFEKQYEGSVLRVLSDYGVGASELTSAKGKILGAGYEPYILAFFLGLYANKRIPLSADTKVLGQPLMYWGNLDSKKGRNAYPKLRENIFVALVARTDIDLLGLDRGDVEPKEVVSQLIQTMEEYANYGFAEIEDKLENQPDFFYQNTGFLSLFMNLMNPNKKEEEKDDEEIEDLSVEEDDEAEELVVEEESSPAETPVKTVERKWSPGQIRELVKFHKEGLSIEQCAVYFDRSEESVIEQLKLKGLI